MRRGAAAIPETERGEGHIEVRDNLATAGMGVRTASWTCCVQWPFVDSNLGTLPEGYQVRR